ncbi:hypothetical protein [Legionella waltersii]|uniref:Adenosine deaminase n=1 Tax=Legionella waltersii TaxID=66969 RepID=A0A0W1A1K0_9GAMM|nr:hypothetical protein [Legionella waltersii]KTD75204.1 adenosine deaminase [Legionella waltersii]SNV10480.1 adenosine deaminase [Legionella waltersii]
MTKKHTADLHNHLNGSFSLLYLKKTAEKNKCLAFYEDFVNVREEYLQLTSKQPEEGYSEKVIDLVWKQFGLIHKIVQDLDDIFEGVLDVVGNSSAKYLEIRTTPKAITPKTRDDYIEAFEQGLLEANKRFTNKKAVGLLSLDRTIHTAEDAKAFISHIKNSPHHVLAGLDISGNPSSKVNRTLTGDALTETINLVLNSGLSIAIHMGETDTEIEKQDTDKILSTLEKWVDSIKNKGTNPLHGRVRFGHCIFLTEQQKLRIAKLQASIEVCPTCHSKLNWHLEKSPHPVASIYPDLSDPIVVGTDDEAIFGSGTKHEFDKVLSFFSNVKNLSRKKIKEHQAAFRFTN